MVYKKNIDCQRLGNKVCFRTSHKPLNKIFAEFFLRHTCVRPAAFRTLPKGQISVVRTDIYDGIDKNISHIKVKANRINRYMERYPSPQYLSQVSPPPPCDRAAIFSAFCTVFSTDFVCHFVCPTLFLSCFSSRLCDITSRTVLLRAVNHYPPKIPIFQQSHNPNKKPVTHEK